MQFGPRIMQRVAQLAEHSEAQDRLCRRYLTPEHQRANALVEEWMLAAGMHCHIDAAGNVVGRYEGLTPGQPALLIGSHLDTVRDAGPYDGMLGVLVGIECIDALNAAGERLPYALEVVGFGDEEGVRFQATLIGSSAIAGTFDQSLLNRVDSDGVTMAFALREFGLDPDLITTAARSREDIVGYVEVHIEQGPVLDNEDLPLGVVTAIAGASRFNVRIIGCAGHAGTVPMTHRRDALAGAAEMILAVEQRAQRDGLVGTVGQIESAPGAVNVISGASVFSLDIRSGDDATRTLAVQEICAQFTEIAERRGLQLELEQTHDAPACQCAPHLANALGAALQRHQLSVRKLPSGAGHDAMAMAALTDVAMLFVRCEGGISHHPDEQMTTADADLATVVLLDFLKHHQAFLSA